MHILVSDGRKFNGVKEYLNNKSNLAMRSLMQTTGSAGGSSSKNRGFSNTTKKAKTNPGLLLLALPLLSLVLALLPRLQCQAKQDLKGVRLMVKFSETNRQIVSKLHLPNFKMPTAMLIMPRD